MFHKVHALFVLPNTRGNSFSQAIRNLYGKLLGTFNTDRDGHVPSPTKNMASGQDDTMLLSMYPWKGVVLHLLLVVFKVYSYGLDTT